jgi:predicted dehydrogenase
MKFAVYGCRHYHIESAAAELLKLGYGCAGAFENKGPQIGRLIREHGFETLENSDALFAKKPDIVLCGAVNDEKIDVIEDCAAHGVDIMLDKPLVTSMKDYLRLENVVKAGKIKVGMMLTERFNPPVYTLKQLIDEGKIGTLVSCTFDKPHKLTPSTRESWHFDRRQNGGPVVDLMIHDFDLIRWFTGSEVKKASGYIRKGDREGYPQLCDDAKVLTVMENGVTSSMSADWWTPDAYATFGKGHIVCTGTGGKAEAFSTGEPAINGEPGVVLLSTAAEPQKIIPCRVPGRCLMEDFIALERGEKSIISQNDVLAATKASLKADENCETL